MCGPASCKSTVKVLLFAHPSAGAGKREPLFLVSVPLWSCSDGFGAFSQNTGPFMLAPALPHFLIFPIFTLFLRGGVSFSF